MEYNDKNATEEIAKIVETENLNEEAEFETEDKPRGENRARGQKTRHAKYRRDLLGGPDRRCGRAQFHAFR